MKKFTLVLAITSTAFMANAQMGYGSQVPRNWYEKIGIHKIAEAVDLVVDKHGNNPIIASNERAKAAFAGMPRPALKFMVTAGVAKVLGGPQKIGPMDPMSVAKWFNFNSEQKKAFYEDIYWGFQMVGLSNYDAKSVAKEIENAINRSKKIDSLPQGEQFSDSKSLYARLGGIVPIALVMDEFLKRLGADPVIHSNPKVVHALMHGNVTEAGLRFLVTEQVAAAAGGPFKYSGRSMAVTHKGLNISEAEWEAGGKTMKAVFDAFKVPQKEQEELFQIVLSLKKDIVGR